MPRKVTERSRLSTTHSRGQSRREVTLARALSKLGASSRARAVDIIRQGRVKVNGEREVRSSAWVDLRKDVITLDGRRLRKPQFRYFVFHKPVGVITTRHDERGRETVYDVLPEQLRGLFPVGRLDKDTSGLIVFTNDTQFGESVASPISRLPKVYHVQTDRTVADMHVQMLERPMELADGTCLQPAHLRKLDADATYEITVTEGKNRQIRRMFEFVGHEIRSLHRVAIGPIAIGRLKEGELRRLTNQEVDDLREHFFRSRNA